MVRYTTVSSIPGIMEVTEYEIPKVDFGESITDTSHFIPSAEAVKSIAGALTDRQINSYYDFPDGHDTGVSVPVGRKPGLDIAEISTSIRSQQNAIDSEVKKTRKNAKLKAELKAKYGAEEASGQPGMGPADTLKGGSQSSAPVGT